MKFLESFDSYKSLPIIFVGGLDYRSGDWSLDKQLQVLKTYLPNRKITVFCSSSNKKCKIHNSIKKLDAIEFLKRQPNSIVLLFSGGTGISQRCSELITNKKNLFILEPYPQAKDNVIGAINNGVPVKNVILGPKPGRGGVVSRYIRGYTSTPSGFSHFGSIEFASEVISKLT